MKRALLIGMITLIIVIIGVYRLAYTPKATVNLSGEKIKVTVSIPLLKYLTEQIGGDRVLVESIIKGAACSHDYEPGTGDMRQVADSALLIKVGLDFDHWFDKLVEIRGGQALYLDASRGIQPLPDDEDHEHGMDEGTEHHHDHTLSNPHYWGDPGNIKIAANNILQALVELCPDGQESFQANYDRFVAKLEQTAVELKKQVQGIKSRKIVSYSAAFPYFFRYFGFNNLGTVETTCEQEISPKRLMEMVKLIKVQGVTVVVGEEIYPQLPDVLAKETGAKVVLLWPTTVESGDYLETLKTNVEKMVSALQ